MKYQETSKDRLKSNVEYIDIRWEQLSNLSLDLINNGVNYLFLINSGAAVALLAFMGSSEKVRLLKWSWYSLTFFILGLLIVGIINFARFHQIEYLYKNWRKDVLNYYDNKICFDSIIENDAKRSKRFSWIVYFGYFSFMCFIIGIALTVANVSLFVDKEREMAKNSVQKTILENSVSEKKNHVPMKSPPPPVKKNK